MLYDTFLFLHIIGVIVWIGGGFTLTVLNLRLVREPSATARESLSSAGEFFGSRIFGPAAGLTLATGIVMVGLMGWITPAWVIWGLCALFASGFVGAVFIGRTARALAESSAKGDAQASRITSLRRRLMLWDALNVLILLSAIWAMVFKPVF